MSRKRQLERRCSSSTSPPTGGAAVLLALLIMLASCSSNSSPTAASITTITRTPTPSPLPTLAPTWTTLPMVPSPPLRTIPAVSPSETSELILHNTAAVLVVAQPGNPTAEVTTPPQGEGPATSSPTATNTPVPSTATLSPTPIPTLPENPTPVATTVLTEDLVHILLIGGDRHYIPDQNTDVLIVAVIDRKNGQVSLLSIPRDLWVYIPEYGYGRINTAHRLGARNKYAGGGPGLLMQTIEDNLGISIDHWGRIDYQGFERVVDTLGGVEMTVPCRVNLRYRPPQSDAEEEMILEPGVYHMDGATALRYVRTRRNETDFDRSRRQHQFLKAMWDQTKDAGIILKLPALWLALKGAFQTDLTLGDVGALAPMALELRPQRVRSLYIGRAQTQSWTTPEGAEVLVPIPEKMQQLVARLYAPPSAQTDQVAGEGARIQVRNGTGQPMLARIAADQVRWEGLQVVDAAPADRSDVKKTQIIVFNDKPKAVELLTRVFQVRPENVIQQPDPNQPADILILLGKDYDPCR